MTAVIAINALSLKKKHIISIAGALALVVLAVFFYGAALLRVMALAIGTWKSASIPYPFLRLKRPSPSSITTL